MILDQSAGSARCLQFDYDATTTAQSPPLNVIHCARWDLLEPSYNFLCRILEPFEALASNPSDMEYCESYLGMKFGLASIPQKLVGPRLLYFYYHKQVQVFLFMHFKSYPFQLYWPKPEALPKVLKATPTALATE